MKKAVFNAEFICGIVSADKFPKSIFPEVAFAGRSNVGKSSLINSFVLRKNLARVSSAPGKTQEINFFLIEKKWTLVDMPGYGYSSKGLSSRETWAKLNNQYIDKRENLKLVCSLIDSRHDPLDSDLAFIEHLENIQQKYLIILTKTDKLSKKQVEERKEQIDVLVSQCNYCVEVLPYSSVTGEGREDLIGIIKRECVLDKMEISQIHSKEDAEKEAELKLQAEMPKEEILSKVITTGNKLAIKKVLTTKDGKTIPSNKNENKNSKEVKASKAKAKSTKIKVSKTKGPTPKGKKAQARARKKS
jgi:GTP-binding protein